MVPKEYRPEHKDGFGETLQVSLTRALYRYELIPLSQLDPGRIKQKYLFASKD